MSECTRSNSLLPLLWLRSPSPSLLGLGLSAAPRPALPLPGDGTAVDGSLVAYLRDAGSQHPDLIRGRLWRRAARTRIAGSPRPSARWRRTRRWSGRARRQSRGDSCVRACRARATAARPRAPAYGGPTPACVAPRCRARGRAHHPAAPAAQAQCARAKLGLPDGRAAVGLPEGRVDRAAAATVASKIREVPLVELLRVPKRELAFAQRRDHERRRLRGDARQ